MKKLFLLLLLVACFDTPTGFTDHIQARTIAEQVAFVDCDPIVYDISDATTGTCNALNTDSTLVDPTITIWTSSVPAAILITSIGDLQVGTVVSASVDIAASGPNGSFASQTLSSVP